MNYLRTLLCGSSLREFDELELQGNTTNNHLKLITKGLLDYFSPMNGLSKQKRAVRRAMRKPRDMSFQRFAAQLMGINNFLHIFPGSEPTKKMTAK